jgi:hypothetical protein
MDTLATYRGEGLQFVPMVVEGCGGGWSVSGLSVWRPLGHMIAACSGDSASDEVERTLEAAIVVAQWETARAVLSRLAESALIGPFLGLGEPWHFEGAVG